MADTGMHQIARYQESRCDRTHALFNLLVHHRHEGIPDRILEVERRKILTIVTDADARSNARALRRAARQGLEKRRLADAIRPGEQEVLILPERYLHGMRNNPLILHRRERRNAHDFPDELRLAGNDEPADGLVFPPHLHLRFLKLRRLLAHTRGNEPHLPAFLRKFVRLLFFLDDGLFELDVFAVLFLDAPGYFLHHIEIVADVLLDLPGEDVKI